MSNRRCRCGKRRFRDHQEAVSALHNIRNKYVGASESARYPIRSYACPICSGFHLTSGA